jgi:hypothetical protein
MPDTIIGKISPPDALKESPYLTTDGSGLFVLLSNIFKLAGFIAGIFFLVQTMLAGYGYLTASGDQKKAEAAWNKISQSLIGLVIVASAFVIASVVGSVLHINILNPQI